jgi:hypothetical protein
MPNGPAQFLRIAVARALQRRDQLERTERLPHRDSLGKLESSTHPWLQKFLIPATCPIEHYLREKRGAKGTYSFDAMSALPSVSRFDAVAGASVGAHNDSPQSDNKLLH